MHYIHVLILLLFFLTLSLATILQGPINSYVNLNPPHTEPLIPKWSLGYWQSGWGDETLGYAHQDSFLDHAKALRGILPNQYGNHSYPADVMVLDMYWCDLNWNWPNNMLWSYTRYPDPINLINQLHAMHYKFAMNFHASGFGTEWLSELKGFLGWGLDVAWLDFWTQDSSEQVQVWDLLKEIHGNNKRIFFFGRHYARPNKYNEEGNPYGTLGFDKPPFNQPIEKTMPMHWTGDQQGSWNGFMETIEEIVYGVDGAMDGWSYLHADTPGHIGGDDPELANRWIQFSDFSPFTRNHGASARDVWSWGSTVEENSRFSRMLRYRLLPYIYTYCWVIYDKAIPLTRPFKLAYPGQRDDIRYQYMFGEELLVAPVYQTQSYFPYEMMDVYLPEGEEWINYWDHQLFNGGQTIKVNISQEYAKYIPLFVKRGGIIPMGPEISWIDEDVHANPLTLDIYPLASGSSSFTFYDDDGKSMDYTRQNYSQTIFICSANELQIEVSISETKGVYAGKPESQDYIIKLNLLSSDFSQVSNNGILLAQVDDYKKVIEEEAETNTWAVDSNQNILYARIKTPVDVANKLICSKASYSPLLSRIQITPFGSKIELNQTQQFKAIGIDQHGQPISELLPSWSVSGGKITQSGLFFGKELGYFKVVAQQGNTIGEALIEVVKSMVISDGIYKVTARHSGKVLDVSSGSTTNGAQIQQFADNGTPAQRWKIIDLGDSFYRLEPQCSKKTLEVFNSNLTDGGRVQQWDFIDIESQIWRIDEVEAGFYKIVNLNSGKALDVEGYSMNDGAIVHQWTYLGQQNQQWELTLMESIAIEEKELLIHSFIN